MHWPPRRPAPPAPRPSDDSAELAELRDKAVALTAEVKGLKEKLSKAVSDANMATHRALLAERSANEHRDRVSALETELAQAKQIGQAAVDVATAGPPPCEHTATLAQWYLEVDHHRNQSMALVRRLRQLGEDVTFVEYVHEVKGS